MDSILTVDNEASSYDLVTLANVKTIFGISDTSQDAKLRLFITQASKQIAKLCNRVFASEDVIEQFRVKNNFRYGLLRTFPPTSLPRHTKLSLSRYPVSEITSVVENGVSLTSDQYEVDPESGELARLVNDSPAVWCGPKIVVTYTGGFEKIPEDLAMACIDYVAHLKSAAGRDPYLKQREVIDIEMTQYFVGGLGPDGSESLPASVAAVVESYRKISLAAV